MQWESIFHVSETPYAFPVGDHELKVRIRAKKGEIKGCSVLFCDRYVPPGNEQTLELTYAGSDRLFDYFETVILSETKRVRYLFRLKGNDGNDVWYGENGPFYHQDEATFFQYAYISGSDQFTVPEWVHDAIVYQIFPERFYNGNQNNDPQHTLPWNEKPESDSFFGGDLEGILEKLPYLSALGINVIYLTPIFHSPTNHKYDTTDYYSIDPHFGDLDTCKKLVDKAHQLGIRVIFDAVFNHCGDQFFAFEDVKKKGADSKYKDWFFIRDFPVVQSPEANYETFAINVPNMPKLNTGNPEVKDYLLKVVRFWMEETGIDGWRLDVSNEVDHQFWRDFRKLVKGIKGDALIVGEIWHHSGPWLRGDQFDGVMNYLFREAVLDFFGGHKINVSMFNHRLTQSRMNYPDQANVCMFNLLDSHDTERFLTSCEKSGESIDDKRRALDRMKLAVAFQMTYLGMPMIYYGDEVGMTGETDPDCRRTMIWEEENQNLDLLHFYKRLIHIRKQSRALKKGEFGSWIEEDRRNIFGFHRTCGDETIGVLLNNSPNIHQISVPIDWKPSEKTVIDLFTEQEYSIFEQTELTLPPYGFMILK